MSQAESWTVKRLLEWTTDFLRKKGFEGPRLEAEILLAAALGVKRIDLYTSFDTEPEEEKRTKFRDFVKRRGAGEPVAYLVGHKEFYSLSFKVTPDVLIPRPETEQLVLSAIDFLKTFPHGKAPRVCDVGTGSGAIAVALARNWPKSIAHTKIVALDSSPKALAIARENGEKHAVSDRIDWVESDLLENTAGPFDLILSNPPYVSESEFDSLDAEVRNYEPKSALIAGKNGTEIIHRLIVQAKEGKLNSGGTIMIELSPMIADAVAALFDSSWNDVHILKDHSGLKRIAIANLT